MKKRPTDKDTIAMLEMKLSQSEHSKEIRDKTIQELSHKLDAYREIIRLFLEARK